MKAFNNLKLALSLCLAFFMSYSFTQACNNSNLSLNSLTQLPNGDYQIDMDLCVGGGITGASLSTIDFWFEVYGNGVILQPNGFPANLNSGQDAVGCTNCRDAIGFYNSIGAYATGTILCPAPTYPCPSGDSTCVWYSANAPIAPNSNSYYSALPSPIAKNCPGPPAPGDRFYAYTDVDASSGPSGSYCVNVILITRGIPDSVVVKGLENTSGFIGYCDDASSKIVLACGAMSADAGQDTKVYQGYAPAECTTLNGSVSGGNGPYTYSWSTGQTTASIQVCPTATTTYTLTVTDNLGCQSFDQVVVAVEDVRCGKGNKNVLLCHNGSARCVRLNKVAQHLAHGDELGACVNKMGAEAGSAELESRLPELVGESLLEAYPNPFSEQTKLRFSVEEAGLVKIEVYALDGRMVADLFEGQLQPGEIKEVDFQSKDLPGGMYFARMVSDRGESLTQKLILNK